MQWSDEGLILSVRPHGETAAIVELLTAQHGRYAGLVHGGRSRRARPVLQIGNHVDAVWKARLADQLGHVSLELRRGYAAEAMSDARALAGLSCLTTMARLLPERDPHPALYEVAMFVLSFLDDPTVWPALYARWELALLDELGFGLDLSACASTGTRDNLIYVSPRSGRAVSGEAGEPYKARLLPLPAFMRDGSAGSGITPAALRDAFRLTGHFLEARVLTPAGQALPEVRSRLVDLVTRQAP
jgi:DNA repair protein RecO (recombination protein O)